MNEEIILSTTQQLEGYYIEQYLGIISRDVVYQNSFIDSLGSSIDRFAAGFKLSALEISSSSRLVQNAKEYLQEEFIKEAQKRRANAVVGVDIEAAVISDIVRVSMNGTAVIAREITPDTVSENLTDNTLQINETNCMKYFVPSKFMLSITPNKKNIALRVKQTDGQYNIGHVLADLVFTSIFGETITIQDVCFLNFKDVAPTEMVSDSFPVDLPERIYRCISKCAVIIKKCFINDELIAIDSSDLSDIAAVTERKKADALRINSIINTLKVKNSPEEMKAYLDGVRDYLPEEQYRLLYSSVQAKMSGNSAESSELMEKLCKEIQIDESDRKLITPIRVNEHTVRCPFCGKEQRSDRSNCYKCGAIFKA